MCYEIPALLPSGTNADRNNIVVVVTHRKLFKNDHIDKLNELALLSDIQRNRDFDSYNVFALKMEPEYYGTFDFLSARQGYSNIIYFTPNTKVSREFMDELRQLHDNPNNPKRIAMVVFEYKAKFHSMYQYVGRMLRENDKQGMNEIPFLALIPGAGLDTTFQSARLHSLCMRDDALRVRDMS